MTTLNKKKVLFLITKSNWGGAQRYVYDLATHLPDLNYTATVAVGGTGELVNLLTHASVPVQTLASLQNSMSLTHAFATISDIITLCRQERPDVLHVNSSVAGLLGVIAGRIARVPSIIFTSHGWAFNEDRSTLERFFIKFLHWTTVLLSHRTIAVSNGVLNDMRWPLAWSKMKVINPGRTIGVMYSRDEARTQICSFFPQLAQFSDDPWVVCLAELHPIKRHSVLFSAILTLRLAHPTVRLICIGEGKERAVLESFVATNNLGGNVFIVGALPEAARFLRAFDIMTLISKSESYGYVLHEAALAGLPVIATNVGGITDIVTNNATGTLVPVDDAKAVADALTRYLEHSDVASQYAKAAYEHLKDRTTDRSVRSVTNLY